MNGAVNFVIFYFIGILVSAVAVAVGLSYALAWIINHVSISIV